MEVAQLRAEDGRFQKRIFNKQVSLQTLKRIYYKTLKGKLWRDTDLIISKEAVGHRAN